MMVIVIIMMVLLIDPRLVNHCPIHGYLLPVLVSEIIVSV